MTLHTRVAIEYPLSIDELWAKVREIVGIAPDDERFTDEAETYSWSVPGTRQRMMNLGLGYEALMWITYSYEGLVQTGEPDEDGYTEPRANIVVHFDTAYGYGRDGARFSGCSELHQHLTAELGAWLSEKGCTTWQGYDEFWGDWHLATPVPVAGRR